MTIEISGFCDDRFQPLEDAFRANFDDGFEVGASLAVMRHGEPVVDLWAGHADWKRTRPWERDTQVLLFSSTKVPLIFSFLMLVDRGEVDLDATVATYWPAFAAGGKERVTVREAMTHRAGVPGFSPPVPFDFLHNWEAVTAHIAAEAHWFGGESRVCYHPTTYGFILGEVIRRVDGRLPSQFFREEIAEKAGVDLTLALRSESECERLAGVGYLMPFAPPTGGDPLVGRIMMSAGPGDWTAWERRRADIPAGNGYGNGRAIARLCAIGACGGELDGTRFLSKAMVDEAVRPQVYAEDPFYGWIRLGLGFGLDSEGFRAPTPTCAHWGGYGGSLALFDPVTGVSFGYAMNNLIVIPGQLMRDQPRHQRLWQALGDVISSL